MDIQQILGIVPFAVTSAVVTWGAQAWAYRGKKTKEKHDQDDRMEIHRDDLTFKLLESARVEMNAARAEVDDLREETRKLRSLEQHFYHFQQALDHIEALLESRDPVARKAAEKNARAFLNRMRRMQDAKGTIRNETQAVDSAVAMAERHGGIIELDKDKPL
jgi:hypothetical protein